MTRAYCYQCHRARLACICDYVTSIDNKVNVYVLQHPGETKNPKGSAVIARLGLKNCHLWVGEDFSEHKPLNQLLKKYPDTSYLVYPVEQALPLTQLFKQDKQLATGDSGPTAINLIFIDATWNKAKKIWYQSSCLHSLPGIQLEPEVKSNYRIRKAPGDNYLSTIEAVVSCLSYLEKDAAKYQPLLNVFEKMIDFQIDKMGKEVYERNY